MAGGKIDHQHFVLFHGGAFHKLHGLRHALLSHVFPLVIETFQLLRQYLCLFRCGCHEKLQGSFGRVQPARGVDAGPQHKADMIGADGAFRQTVGRDQRPEALVSRMVQPFQTFFYQDPVLPGEIHHIAHGGKGHVFQQRIPLFGADSISLIEALDQFESHRRSAETFIRVGAVRLFGVDEGIRRRQNFLGLMMIRDDDRHSECFRLGNLLHRGDAVIAGDDRVHLCLRCQLD